MATLHTRHRAYTAHAVGYRSPARYGVIVHIDGQDELRWRVFGERPLYESPWVQLVKVDVEPPRMRRRCSRCRLQNTAARRLGQRYTSLYRCPP